MPNGLVHWFARSGYVNQKILTDSISKITATGTSVTASSTGTDSSPRFVTAGSYYTTGVDDKVVTEGWTCAAWICVFGAATRAYACGSGDSAGNYCQGISVETVSGTVRIGGFRNSIGGWYSGSEISVSNWHFFVVGHLIKDLSTTTGVILDVDGLSMTKAWWFGPQPTSSWESLVNYSGRSFSVGRMGALNTTFNGLVSDVMWFNRGLSPAERQSLYQQTRGRYNK